MSRKNLGGRNTPTRWLVPAATALVLGAGTCPAVALTVIPTFSSSITSQPNAAAIEAAINQADAAYNIFTNPETVTVLYQATFAGAGPSVYNGESVAGNAAIPYATYTGALATNATASSDPIQQSVVSNLGSGNTATQVFASTADLRALGFSNYTGYVSSINPVTNQGVFNGPKTYDGAMMLNLSQNMSFALNPTSLPSNQVDGLAVIEHETDEILGIGGNGSTLNLSVKQGSTPPWQFNGGTAVGPIDLLRYSAPGVPSLTTANSAPIAYFSITGGATKVTGANGPIFFNQNNNSDYGDWANGTGNVQDANYIPTNQVSKISGASPEAVALQAIGYNLPPCIGECTNTFNKAPVQGGKSFGFVLKGNLVDQIDTSLTASDKLVNPYAYLGQASTVMVELDGSGNTEVIFTGTSPITTADTFNYGGGPGAPHFGFEGTSGPLTPDVIGQFWGLPKGGTDNLGNLGIGCPAPATNNLDYAVVFANVTPVLAINTGTIRNSIGNAAPGGVWTECAFDAGTSPTFTLTNTTTGGELVSNLGYFVTSNPYALDSLNVGSLPPDDPLFNELGGLDGLLGSGGVETFTVAAAAVPEPGSLAVFATGVVGLIARRRRGRH